MTAATMWAKRLSSSYSWTNSKKPDLMQIIGSEVSSGNNRTICPAAASQEVSNEREPSARRLSSFPGPPSARRGIEIIALTCGADGQWEWGTSEKLD